MERFERGENNKESQPIRRDESAVVVLNSWIYPLVFLQKSKEEKKKKKKHKHEEKGEDLLGGQADEPVVQSEETNEVTAPPTSTSAEVCVEHGCFLPGNRV